MITHAAPLPPDFYEKTLRNIANLRQEHGHDATLHRFLGDAEAAIANLIVLEAEATTTFKEAAEYASTVQYERDTARGAVQALEATVRRLEVEIGQATRDLGGAHDTHSRLLETVRDALGAEPGQGVTWKARAVVRERDEARAERDRALAAALEARDEIEDWRTRFDALATRAADLVKERDEARAALFAPPIDPVSFAQKFARTRRDRDLLKVGDRVVNKKRVVEVATVIGFFDSIDGVRFAAVENDFGRADFWRLDLVSAVKS